MHIHRLFVVAGAIGALAACGRSAPNADSAAVGATAGAATTSSIVSPGDPPPPPIDTTGTLYLMGAAAGTTMQDSATFQFSYDTAGTSTYRAMLQAGTTDGVTVDPNTSLTGGDTQVSGTGRITVRRGGATIVADLSKGIGQGSSLGKCPSNVPAGRGRCGTVMLDSVEYTPSGGSATYRRARIDLGH
jgi:hypothetical protein